MSNNSEHKSSVKASLVWKFLERGGVQGIQFFVQILLARMLLPEMYGTVALVNVFISIALIFVQSGFATALVQKKEADNLDFSSVFYFNIALAILMYILLFFTAPLISNYYRDEQLIPILRVLGIILFFGAVNSVQNAYIARNMMFKKQFYLSITALLVSGIASVIAAYAGLGVWSLVIQQLVNQVTNTFIMWIAIRWRPDISYSSTRIKKLLSFGWKLLLASLMDTLYHDLRTLVIGRVYSHNTLGFYNKGEQFPKLLVTNVNGSIQAVILPAMSMSQDDRQRVKSLMRRTIKISSFVMFPLMALLAVMAQPIVRILLTEKWIPAVPFLQMFCFGYILWPIHTANLQAINALGRSDIFLKLEIIKKVIGIAILILSVPMGPMAIAAGVVITGGISSIVNAWPNRRLLNYSFLEQLMDILPAAGLSAATSFCVWIMSLLSMSTAANLALQIVVGVTIYVLLARAFNVESAKYLWNEFRLFRNKA